MYGTVLCLAVVFGVDAGWRRLPEGGFEYVIQIEPDMLEALKAGEEIFSDVPPEVRDVRSYRITVGTGALLREGGLEAAPGAPEAQPPPERPASDPDTPASAEPSAGDQGALDTMGPGAPRQLVPPDDTSPLAEVPEKTVAFMQQEAEPYRSAAGQEGVGASKEAVPPKPWFPLTLALAACFGSLGGMLYLGWIAWGYRRQYRALLERLIEAGDEPSRVAEDQDLAGG